MPTATPSFNDIYLRVAASVVYIETPDGSGSGWAVREGLVATNEHVVDGSARVTIRHLSGGPVVGTVVFTDPVRDIAFVSYDPAGLALTPLPMHSLGVTDIGRPVMVLGYAGAGVKADGTVGSPPAKLGALSQIVDFGSQGGRRLRVDAVMDPGDSGGPTVDLLGRVVGMNQSTVETASSGRRVVGIFYAVHADEISARLREFLGE
jgi:serine protease Do